jgi:hypothetical protein
MLVVRLVKLLCTEFSDQLPRDPRIIGIGDRLRVSVSRIDRCHKAQLLIYSFVMTSVSSLVNAARSAADR